MAAASAASATASSVATNRAARRPGPHAATAAGPATALLDLARGHRRVVQDRLARRRVRLPPVPRHVQGGQLLGLRQGLRPPGRRLRAQLRVHPDDLAGLPVRAVGEHHPPLAGPAPPPTPGRTRSRCASLTGREPAPVQRPDHPVRQRPQPVEHRRHGCAAAARTPGSSSAATPSTPGPRRPRTGPPTGRRGAAVVAGAGVADVLLGIGHRGLDRAVMRPRPPPPPPRNRPRPTAPRSTRCTDLGGAKVK